MMPNFILFDTKTDTKKFFVPVKTTIKVRPYVDKDGKSLLYLHVFHKERRRIALDIYIDKKKWDEKKQELKGEDQYTQDINLQINQVKNKIHDIKLHYRLTEKILSLDGFIEEFNSNYSKNDFIGFFKKALEYRKGSVEKSTYIKEKAVLNKLQTFCPTLRFHEIDYLFFTKYRGHLSKIGNQRTTRNANIKIIKRYLRIALKNGARIAVDIEDIKVGSTMNDKPFLNQAEVNKMFRFFLSEFCTGNQKLSLAYFLFSCFTGLRISDILKAQRPLLTDGFYWLRQTKTKGGQSIELNNTAKRILKETPNLFVDFLAEQTIREHIKAIALQLNISKEISYHTSRHTFATNFILMGGDVARLQYLLGHKNIKTTMVYVHMAEAEKHINSDILDGLIHKT